MYENRDSYVDKPVLESRTVYISGNFNQIIKFELKKSLFNSNFGYNNKNIKSLKSFAKILKVKNSKGDSNFGGLSNYPSSIYMFKVPAGSKIKNIDNNYNIIHKGIRYTIDKIENIELEGLYYNFYCSKEGDENQEQARSEQKEVSLNKKEEKIEW